jgi:AraC-like DNA-binding protein
MADLFPFYSIGHFINEPSNPTEFEIMRFENMDEPEVEDPHKHTFYEILWVEAGNSSQMIDHKEYVVEPNTLFFISPGQIHQFEEWQGIRGGSIFFTEDFFLFNQQNKDKLFELSFLDNLYAHPCLKPDNQSYTEISYTIDVLLREHCRADRSQSITQSLLHILLAQIQRCIDKQAQMPDSKNLIILFKKCKHLLDQHFREHLTASDYAERLNITQHHLNHVVKHVTGKTTTELIRARNILEAKRLLAFTDNTIAEIAAQLGFFDSSYFSKMFRIETGMSPSAFKASISEKYRIR